MEAEANFMFSIFCLDKTDLLSGQKFGEKVVVCFKPDLTLMVNRSNFDAVIVLRFADLFRESPG